METGRKAVFNCYKVKQKSKLEILAELCSTVGKKVEYVNDELG